MYRCGNLLSNESFNSELIGAEVYQELPCENNTNYLVCHHCQHMRHRRLVFFLEEFLIRSLLFGYESCSH